MGAGLEPLSAGVTGRRRARRFAVVSAYFPPVVGGTATVMWNVLKRFRREAFEVVAETPGSFDGVHLGEEPDGVGVARFGVPPWVSARVPYGVKMARWVRFGLMPAVEAAVVRARPEAVVAVYPSWPFFWAACRAATRLGVPYYTYHMDITPRLESSGWPDRPAVGAHDRRWLAGAAERLALSPAVAEDLRARFGVGSVVVPHGIEVPAVLPEARREVRASGRRVVHTGVVEHLQREGLMRVRAALAGHPELKAELALSTPTHRSALAGFEGVEIRSLPSAEVAGFQAGADVLVAVMPFEGADRSFALTSFPTKVTEYMLSGVPILAHAPEDSYFARHARERGYALVVDDPSAEALAGAMGELFGNASLRERLVGAAQRTVREEFASLSVARRFAEACGLDPAALAG
jgi:glycosyltransferase involved in cell wall biosynthesis